MNRRVFLSTAVTFWALAGGAENDEAVWTEYLVWLQGQELKSFLGLSNYGEVLRG